MRAAEDPRVSVVTIFKDAERFLGEAIDSVFGQTVTDWEYILVDDGSVDGGAALAARAVAARPASVRLLTHPGGRNMGMSASRNLGVTAATGRYVAFLDADDVLLPTKLERQLELAEAHPEVGMVFGPTRHWYSWSEEGARLGADYESRLPSGGEGLYRPPGLVRAFLEGKTSTPATCGALIARDAFWRAGGFVADFRGMFEDQAFFYKICAREPVYVMAAGLDLYRQHVDSTCYRALAEGRWDYVRPNPEHRRFMAWLGEELRLSLPGDRGTMRRYRAAAAPYLHPVRYRARSEAVRVWHRLRWEAGRARRARRGGTAAP